MWVPAACLWPTGAALDTSSVLRNPVEDRGQHHEYRTSQSSPQIQITRSLPQRKSTPDNHLFWPLFLQPAVPRASPLLATIICCCYSLPLTNMADVLDQVRDVVDGQIDFEGQKVTELLATILLVISGALSFLVGYMLQDIKLAVYVGLGGTGLTFLAVVPPWPIFNKNPVKWLPAGYTVDMAESKSSQ